MEQALQETGDLIQGGLVSLWNGSGTLAASGSNDLDAARSLIVLTRCLTALLRRTHL